jgi:DNA-binding transcriptional ArsR family regulator
LRHDARRSAPNQDARRTAPNHDARRSAPARLRLAVDWAPAYELVLSLICFVTFPKHNLLELGEGWAREVRSRLPADLAVSLQRKNVAAALNLKEDDLLLLLVRTCPGDRDAASFIRWLSRLNAGEAYEAVGPRLRDTGPRLPRDFANWRDRCVSVLHTWQDAYFDGIDPAILTGLWAEANRLSSHLVGPPQAVVERVTNGIYVEPTPEPLTVTLVPQYHQRPYNHDAMEQGGLIILYPADICPVSPDHPPAGLLRVTRALSDESRLRMLRFLADGTRTLSELARFTGLTQPTVHHHLVQLRAAGLVRAHVQGAGSRRYSLRPRALDQLRNQLTDYLNAPASETERQQA